MSHPLEAYLEATHPDLTLDARLKLFADSVERSPRVSTKRKRGRAVKAERLTTTGNYLYQIVRGYRHPSRQLARRIESVTGGKVNAGALLAWVPATEQSQLAAS